jgi:hypothetical protein
MLERFSVSILEEGGRLGLKCLLLSYFRMGDFRMGDNPPGTPKTRPSCGWKRASACSHEPRINSGLLAEHGDNFVMTHLSRPG